MGNREALTYFEQVIKLIQLAGIESDFLGHHSNLKRGSDEHHTVQQQIHHWPPRNLKMPNRQG